MAEPSMPYNYLGSTGLRVSSICLGTMTFAIENEGAALPTTPKGVAVQMLDAFAAAGGNFIDTADMYNRGQAEEILGEWLETQNRSEFVIATKARWPIDGGVNANGLSRKRLIEAVDDSLRRLRTNYIDLYYIHAWDGGTPLKETLSALNDLVRAGKIHYIGIANFSGWQLQKAVDLCEKYDYAPITCIQQQYSLLCRETELEIAPCVKDNKLALLPWSPLKGGWLTGRYQPNTMPGEDTRVGKCEATGWITTNYSAQNTQQTYHIIETLQRIAKSLGKEPAQVALRWLLQKQDVPSVIIGARTMEHFTSNIGAAFFQLSHEHMAELDYVSQAPVPYPYHLDMTYGAARHR